MFMMTVLCYAGYPLASLLGVWKGGAMENIVKSAICGVVTIVLVAILVVWLVMHLRLSWQ